jgi:hypothetical protein
MLLQGKRLKAAILLLAALITATLAAQACRKNDKQPLPESVLSGEPDEYSATIVRTVEDGTGRWVVVTRVARSGAMFREEWSEQGETRAFIWRPDLGKSFLLFPDNRTYVESEARDFARPEKAADAVSSASSSGGAETGESAADETRREPAPSARRNPAGRDDVSPAHVSPDYIDRSFGDIASPSRVETRALADQMIEGYACAVTEQRAVFDDGRGEVTRIFRARELAGLAVRVEVESEGVKIITERRDIQIQVPPDNFTVPTDFRKVASRARR